MHVTLQYYRGKLLFSTGIIPFRVRLEALGLSTIRVSGFGCRGVVAGCRLLVSGCDLWLPTTDDWQSILSVPIIPSRQYAIGFCYGLIIIYDLKSMAWNIVYRLKQMHPSGQDGVK
jgi:hypothetical protein